MYAGGKLFAILLSRLRKDASDSFPRGASAVLQFTQSYSALVCSVEGLGRQTPSAQGAPARLSPLGCGLPGLRARRLKAGARWRLAVATGATRLDLTECTLPAAAGALAAASAL